MCFYTTYTFKCGCVIWGNEKVAPCHESKTLQSNNNNSNNSNNEDCPNKKFHAFHSRNLTISCTHCNVQKRIKAKIHEIKHNIEKIAEKHRKREQAKKGYGVKVISDSQYITGWRFAVEVGEAAVVDGEISSLKFPSSGFGSVVVSSSPLMVEKMSMEKVKVKNQSIAIPEPEPKPKPTSKPESELSVPKKQIITTIPKSSTGTSTSTSKILQPPKNEGRESQIRAPVPVPGPKRGSSTQVKKSMSDKKKER